MYKPIELPNLKDYYAGNDGEIYKYKCINDVYVMYKLNPQFTTKGSKVKYVHLLFDCKEKAHSFSMQLPVCYLICGAYHGFYKPFHEVKYLDNNPLNTKPSNLLWVFEQTEKKIDKLRDQLEKIKNKYENK
jgi:hypothetical protein